MRFDLCQEWQKTAVFCILVYRLRHKWSAPGSEREEALRVPRWFQSERFQQPFQRRHGKRRWPADIGQLHRRRFGWYIGWLDV